MSGDEALLELLHELRRRQYEFAAVTPATHARFLSRPFQGRPTLRDIFGWNRPFSASDLEPRLLALIEAADALRVARNQLRSKVRVATLAGQLFIHSCFPTEQHDSVFFGPDTYRFGRFVREHLSSQPCPAWILDMGAGAGAGGILAARSCQTSRVTLIDVNPQALRFAAINAANAGVSVETLHSVRMPPGADLVIANPPYMIDSQKRVYRDGGAMLGGAVALEWAKAAISALRANGRMLLYTGVAYEPYGAPLVEALEQVCRDAGATLSIEELDPDVFGEELENSSYSTVERIAAVGAVITVAGTN